MSGVAAGTGSAGQAFLTTTITSPPYANLVDYGAGKQIGFGQSYEAYLDECEAVFADVFKWTRDDGSLWLVADTLMAKSRRGQPSALIPLPFALAERAAKAGWVMRDVIIWRKDRTRPWATAGRLRNAFEYVLYFVKSSQAKHRVERLRDVRSLRSWWVKYPERHNPWGMTPDNVWDIPIPVQGSWATSELRHACPFPDELVRRMVQLSSDEGDVVFDPFSGSGMVAAVAESEGRRPLGTELNADFCSTYEKHIRPSVVQFKTPGLDVDAADLTGALLTLRVLKYPKDLMRQLLRTGVARSKLMGAYVDAAPFDMTPKSTSYGAVTCHLLVSSDTTDDEIEALSERIARAESRPPLSKYGLQVETRVRRASDGFADLAGDREIAVYLEGRTWNSDVLIGTAEHNLWLAQPHKGKIPPVFSPMEIHQSAEDRT
ncbi:UNVERIFIED_ORG: DNA modification methylase [Paenarthrobacter nicotinovorans]